MNTIKWVAFCYECHSINIKVCGRNLMTIRKWAGNYQVGVTPNNKSGCGTTKVGVAHSTTTGCMYVWRKCGRASCKESSAMERMVLETCSSSGPVSPWRAGTSSPGGQGH